MIEAIYFAKATTSTKALGAGRLNKRFAKLFLIGVRVCGFY